MRELGEGSHFLQQDIREPFNHVNILEHCEQRLLAIELDIGSSFSTWDSLKWAISVLQRMELRSTARGSGVYENEAFEACEYGVSKRTPKEQNDDRNRSWLEDSSSAPVRSLASDFGSRNRRSGPSSTMASNVETDVENKLRNGKETVLKVVGIEKPNDARYLDQKFECSPCKRKLDEEAIGNDGDKRARFREVGDTKSLGETLMEADKGVLGKLMEERISARLALPEYILLTNLINQCLLLSMDQHPWQDEEDAANSGNSPDKLTLSSHGSAGGNEWIWLHKWLVSNLLSGCDRESHSATLDWLVAYMTAIRPNIFIRVVVDDLILDVRDCVSKGHSLLTTYLRRAGILEFAAIREPDQVFSNLICILPTTLSGKLNDSELEAKYAKDELCEGCHVSVWLSLVTLCPSLLGAVSRLWIPTLSVEALKSCNLLQHCTNDSSYLPAIWVILLGTNIEEPKSMTAWLYAAFVRRLAQLAPVGVHLAVLLRELCDSFHGSGIGDIAHNLLVFLYKELSKNLLPKVIGFNQVSHEQKRAEFNKCHDSNGAFHFMENLKQLAHILWREALISSSLSSCRCCDIFHGRSIAMKSSTGTEIHNIDDGSGGNVTVKLEQRGKRGCASEDPFMLLCQLTILCCGEPKVARLLADAMTMGPPHSELCDSGLKKMLFVMRIMRMVAGQGRCSPILELWAQHMIDYLATSNDDQSYPRIVVMRQLLDPHFWEKYQSFLRWSSSVVTNVHVEVIDDGNGSDGLGWKLVWQQVRMVLDVHWLQILSLLHREDTWELKLAVLGVLRLLSVDGNSRPQLVADRLKGILGIFFSWVDSPNDSVDTNCSPQAFNHPTQEINGSQKIWESKCRWQRARGMEQVKRIIVELAATSYPSFTLMVHSLLDYSFEHSAQKILGSSPHSKVVMQKTEHSSISQRKAGSANRPSFSVGTLATGRLDKYGRLMLISGGGTGIGRIQNCDMKLSHENFGFQSGGFISLNLNDRDKFGTRSIKRVPDSTSVHITEKQQQHQSTGQVVEAELRSLLRRTLDRAMIQSSEFCHSWSRHPVTVLATLMVDRLETPHEVALTMEQYEEVLPKQISSLRHIFLTECFSQNLLLLEMLELVFKYGGSQDLLRCVEFLRVLLADSISRWHSAFRTRHPHSNSSSEVNTENSCHRLQVNRLIQLVASAGWLPQPIAASGEIVESIDGADIPDLLLLVWRCMHHGMAYGPKGWGGSCNSLQTAECQTQGTTTCSGADEESVKEGSYSEWEGHYFAILRKNISQTGAHFSQVYPLRKSL